MRLGRVTALAPITVALAARIRPPVMPHSRPCPDGLNLDKLDRGHCLAECDMTSGQKLPSQGEREVQRPTRAGRQNALHVQSQGRGIACQPHICACEPPQDRRQTWSFKSLYGIRSHSPKHPFPCWLRWSPQHDASLFTCVSGRATTRSNMVTASGKRATNRRRTRPSRRAGRGPYGRNSPWGPRTRSTCRRRG